MNNKNSFTQSPQPSHEIAIIRGQSTNKVAEDIIDILSHHPEKARALDENTLRKLAKIIGDMEI